MDNNIKNNYFSSRNITQNFYEDFSLPKYLQDVLPVEKDVKILDIGCGLGQMLIALKKLGYNNLEGIDISQEAILFCREQGLNVHNVRDITIYAETIKTKYDFIIMSHVLEHIEKSNIINTLKEIKNRLLKNGGKFCIMVPNAQSNTNCYWAYEDFTHTTLFTAGSLMYVLKEAGFNSIKFLDPKGTESSRFIIRFIKNVLLFFYAANKSFWNKITSSSFHKPSPVIYTYELKVLATND